MLGLLFRFILQRSEHLDSDWSECVVEVFLLNALSFHSDSLSKGCQCTAFALAQQSSQVFSNETSIIAFLAKSASNET